MGWPLGRWHTLTLPKALACAWVWNMLFSMRYCILTSHFISILICSSASPCKPREICSFLPLHPDVRMLQLPFTSEKWRACPFRGRSCSVCLFTYLSLQTCNSCQLHESKINNYIYLEKTHPQHPITNH